LVEDETYLVTLPFVVALLIVVVNDEVSAVVIAVLSHLNVVEATVVFGVRQNVVGVCSLKSLASGHRLLQATECIVVEHLGLYCDVEIELLDALFGHGPKVLLFSDGPLAIVLIQAVPVRVDIFVESDVANFAGREPLHKKVMNKRSKDDPADE